MTDIKIWHVRDSTYLSAETKAGEQWLSDNMISKNKIAAVLTIRIAREVSEEVIAIIKADGLIVEE